MKVPANIHIQFYAEQIKAQEGEWKKYAMSSLVKLHADGDLFVGRIWGLQPDTGVVILRFRSSQVIPRMKKHYYLTLLTDGMPSRPEAWTMSYLTYRASQDPRYCRNQGTELVPRFMLKQEDPKWTYVGVTGFDRELLTEINRDFLSKGKHPACILAEKDPPLEYLHNLKGFVSRYPAHELMTVDSFRNDSDWNLVNLDNEKDILPEVLGSLGRHPITSIQGPPGTGKSYLAAQICQHFLRNQQSVVLTSLTNQALMEVGEKEPLREFLRGKRMYKTNVSSDENKKLGGIQPYVEKALPKGSLLLASYYGLSKLWEGWTQRKHIVDLLIIEEASQAFQATIAMFSELARNLLIIGDHKQLPPVVLKEEAITRLHPNINSIIMGLQQVVGRGDGPAYRLTKTRRLSPASARLTGIFYDNQLKSIAKDPVSYEGKYAALFDPKCGGSRVDLTPSARMVDIYPLIARMVKDLLKSNPRIEIAVLSPLVGVEKGLSKSIAVIAGNSQRVTVSTIHRIQGLSVDYTIVVLPLQNPTFELDDHLFNVATSRARSGTLIIIGGAYQYLTSPSKEVFLFLEQCVNVTPQYQQLNAQI